jgi:hypothetical protein
MPTTVEQSSSNHSTPAATLAIFRIGFGVMMFLSIVRFWWNGWIEKLYLEPTFFFSYQYFEWVKPVGDWTYGIFVLAGLSAIMIMLGWKYRLAATVFFLTFTYIELMDKTTYLNHYYFISLLAFVMIWMPAADYFSFDAKGRPKREVPTWTVNALRAFVGVVYFYAGLAKLNSDWLMEAQPLSIWLPSKYDTPLLGDLLQQPWMHYTFAWSGAAYDLFIPFLLLWKPTRNFAFVMVVIFHVLTRVLFPIGMFPYIMIVSALVFFEPAVHERMIGWMRKGLGLLNGAWGARTQVQRAGKRAKKGPEDSLANLNNFILGNSWMSKIKILTCTTAYIQVAARPIVITLLIIHLLLPWRYLTYPGELFWTESGYRFSWRVMLMEKAGYAAFTIVNPDTGKRRTITNGEYLTTFQEKQMATQPDFILEFAHHLAEEHQQKGQPLPAVYVESYVALNGRGSRPYINPNVNLTTITHRTPRTDWLMPFEDEIYGL